jgi:mRNA interferase MazF
MKMQCMTNYKFGDVLLVPFPFTDQQIIKKRPAVVISTEQYQITHPDVILMAVTSQQQTSAIPDHISIIDWRMAGLLKPSVVKPIVTTLEKQLVVRKLGRFQERDRISLENLISQILGGDG